MGARAAQLFRQRYQGHFHRFVNDDDIVPGVPPGYRHAGRLFWFDAHGRFQAFDADTEALDAGSQPDELSAQEFHKLQTRIHELKEATDKSIDAGPPGLEGEKSLEALAADRQAVFDASVEGLLPSVRDHGIERYITQIRRQIVRPVAVDEAISQAISESRAESFALERGDAIGLESLSPRSKLATMTTVPVLLRVRDPAWKAPPGVVVQSRLGNIVSASAPLEVLDELRSDKGILAIDSSREGGILELTTSKAFVHATAVHQPPIDEKGDSAIVGIIDSGVDVLHEAFLDEAGKTRILFVWDQRSASGDAPSSVNAAAFSQSYGTLYVQSEIQDMIAHSMAPAALRDPALHGTHVTSIAAGRAVGAFAGGLAPEAKLIVVIPNMTTAPGDPPSLGYSNSHVDALSFIQCLRLTLNHRDNSDNLLVITIEPDGSSIQGGLWTLRLLGKTILSPGAGVVHAWVERHRSRALVFDSGDNDEMTLSIPGTANHVITVGACGSAMPLQLTTSSSWGLTRDRRPKPDLVAPGTDVVAARANTSAHQATTAMTGTSMAAPHVTGSIALVLSKRHKDGGKPQVNAVQIRKELVASAQNFTGVHNKGVGYGALDSLAFFNRF